MLLRLFEVGNSPIKVPNYFSGCLLITTVKPAFSVIVFAKCLPTIRLKQINLMSTKQSPFIDTLIAHK